jgi:hypothetical protein
MKLRAVLILATVVLGGMLLSGVALAVTKYGDADPNKLMGTNNTDYIYGGMAETKSVVRTAMTGSMATMAVTVCIADTAMTI